jgi:hypothetical protein
MTVPVPFQVAIVVVATVDAVNVQDAESIAHAAVTEALVKAGESGKDAEGREHLTLTRTQPFNDTAFTAKVILINPLEWAVKSDWIALTPVDRRRSVVSDDE